nr:MAG TPA: hypothetical protein [Microviridae sp.]
MKKINWKKTITAIIAALSAIAGILWGTGCGSTWTLRENQINIKLNSENDGTNNGFRNVDQVPDTCDVRSEDSGYRNRSN